MGEESLVADPALEGHLLKEPFPFETEPASDATTLLSELASRVGAVLPDGRLRDELDDRVIADVMSRTGAVIDHPDDDGGLPTLRSGTAPDDSDIDGMPETWEAMLDGLQANLFDAWNDGDG